jgi:hypothetical protein
MDSGEKMESCNPFNLRLVQLLFFASDDGYVVGHPERAQN